MSDPWDTLPQSWSWGLSCVPVLALCWPCCWTHKHRAVRAVRCPLFGAGSSCVPAGLVPGPRSCGPEAGPCHMAPGQWLSVLGRAVLGGCRMCRTRAPVCVHTSPGQRGTGGFWTLAVFSSPLLSHIRSPCSWHFQDALEAALSCSGHWGLSKNAPKDLLCCGAAPKHKPGGPAVGYRDGIGRMGTWPCLVGLPGPFWCWKGPDNFRSSHPY